MCCFTGVSACILTTFCVSKKEGNKFGIKFMLHRYNCTLLWYCLVRCVSVCMDREAEFIEQISGQRIQVASSHHHQFITWHHRLENYILNPSFDLYSSALLDCWSNQPKDLAFGSMDPRTLLHRWELGKFVDWFNRPCDPVASMLFIRWYNIY